MCAVDNGSLALEFQELCNRRDLAAYRVVSAVGLVLRFWEAEDFAVSLVKLQRAHAEYELADRRINEFRRTHLQQKSQIQIQRGESPCRSNQQPRKLAS
jgi:hypothetical protein